MLSFGSAEIIPFEPDMYNNSAGKRLGFIVYSVHLLVRYVSGLDIAAFLRYSKSIIRLWGQIAKFYNNENNSFSRCAISGHRSR